MSKRKYINWLRIDNALTLRLIPPFCENSSGIAAATLSRPPEKLANQIRDKVPQRSLAMNWMSSSTVLITNKMRGTFAPLMFKTTQRSTV